MAQQVQKLCETGQEIERYQNCSKKQQYICRSGGHAGSADTKSVSFIKGEEIQYPPSRKSKKSIATMMFSELNSVRELLMCVCFVGKVCYGLHQSVISRILTDLEMMC